MTRPSRWKVSGDGVCLFRAEGKQMALGAVFSCLPAHVGLQDVLRGQMLKMAGPCQPGPE